MTGIPSTLPTTVSADGTNVSTPVDGTGRFQLAGLPAGDVRLRFSATGINAAVTVPGVANQQQVEITVSVSGNTAAIVADSRGGSASTTEVEGMVSALSGSCPAIAFTIGTSSVVTNAQTAFAGAACGDVKNGIKVDVKGTKQTDGRVLAQSVRVETSSGGMGDADVEGMVSSLSGTCPSLAFSIGSTAVKTSGATTFVNGSCGDVAAGVKVDVSGSWQSDGSLAAGSVKIEDAGPRGVEIEGLVASISAGAQSFLVEGKTVKVTSATTITHGSTTLGFSDLRVGNRVHVKGTADSTGLVTATRIELQNDNPGGQQSMDVTGLVSAVSGACPSLRFTVGATTVTTTALTTYAGGSCGDLKAGANVEATGSQQPDKSLAAASVKFKR